ncbi:MAG: acyl carrier protein [Clostridiales Family XIII bacterium]|jgi:acyl carrier protein|nr:acyl carrier protein [Clostridiales Family XIII bacterium]
MNRDEIIEKLQSIFREFFGDDSITLTENTTADEVEGWDSVSHIQLVFEAEESFGIQFAADDISQLTLIGKWADSISEMMAGNPNNK